MSSIHLRFAPIFFLLVCDEYQWLRFFYVRIRVEFLKGNDMIPCEIWCASALVNFLMTTKSHSPYGLKPFFLSLDNLLYRQIAIEIMVFYE